MSLDLAPEPAEADWRAAVAKVLRGKDPETLIWRTPDGIALKPLYPAHDGSAAPSTRPTQRWLIGQRVDHPDPAQANLLALADLEGGVGALTLVHADAPTARGFGLDFQTASELETVLADVAIDAIELRLDTGPHGLRLARSLADMAARRGHALAELRLDLGIDPVTLLATAGALPLSWPDSAAELAGTVTDLLGAGFVGAALRADGRPWSEAGASEAQELAAVLASGVLHLRMLEAAGVPLAAARGAISFCLAADVDPVLTIAKLRAARRLWAWIEAACGLSHRPIRLHAETSWRMMTAISPHTNIIRGTAACFAAAVGGADGVTVLPFTLPLGLPDAFARRLARNTQHVLAEESSLWRVADPAGGTGLFEAATDALCAEAWTLFQQLEREGGIIESLVSGLVQKRVARVRSEHEARLGDGSDALVGTTIFAPEDEVPAVVLMQAAPRRSPVLVGPLRAKALVSGRAAEPFEIGRVRP